MAYEEAGYLPEAMLNYLARLGWSHGDDELFTREQMVQWFDGSHMAKSPAQWDPAKLALGQRAIASRWPTMRGWRGWWCAQLAAAGVQADRDATHLARRCALFKDRCATTGGAGDMAGDVRSRR